MGMRLPQGLARTWALLHKFSLKITAHNFSRLWQLRGVLTVYNGWENELEWRGIYRGRVLPTFQKSRRRLVPFTEWIKECSVRPGINHGFFWKSSIRPCGPMYISVLFIERTSSGPPTYVRMPTLVYVHSLGLGFKLCFHGRILGIVLGQSRGLGVIC